MSVYLDASVLVALFSSDTFTNRARAFLQLRPTTVVVSDFAATEFASAIARQVRIHQTTKSLARTAFADFDDWTSLWAERAEISPGDLAAAQGFLRRLDLTLRTGDALNIATASRIGATLATFDDKMQASAQRLGIAIENI